MAYISETTRIMMCAAHLYTSEIKESLEERLTHPYKAPCPEIGLNLTKIKKEIELIEKKIANKVRVELVALVAVIIYLFGNSFENLFPISIYFIVALFAEYRFLSWKEERARKVYFDISIDEESDEEQENSHDCKVFVSGGFSPFVGSGYSIDSWSFPVDMGKANDPSKPIDNVNIQQLHDFIKENIRTIEIDDLEIYDGIFINGKDINKLDHMQSQGRLSPPLTNVPIEYLNDNIGHNSMTERHYRCIRICLWGKQIALSMYYRFTIIKDVLFLEARFFFLPPLDSRFQNIENNTAVSSFSDKIKMFYKSIFKASYSWGALFTHAEKIFNNDSVKKNIKEDKLREIREEAEKNLMYNFGWEHSLREAWSQNEYQRYFQKVDMDIMIKLLNDRFLNAMEKYLKSKNISTERFSESSTQIFNNGVIVSGGSVKADNIAVGENSSATKTVSKNSESKT